MKRSGEMAQYTVLKVYTDKQLGKTLKVEDVVEYTDERFLEVNGFLKQFGGGYLRKVESQKKSRKVKEEVVTEETEE